MYYILDLGEVRPCTAEELGAFKLDFVQNCVIQKTTVGEAEVSTVFLGIDHRHRPDGPPVLFETMVFGGEHTDFQDRYTSLESAKAGHTRVVECLKAGTEP